MLFNKTAMITGCNKGIGKAILKLFSENNCNIIACTRKRDVDFIKYCQELQNKYKITIKNYFFDLSNKDEVNLNLKEVVKENDKIDILVNNAGDISTNSFLMTPDKNFKDTFQINFFSQVTIMQIVSRKMLKNKKGSIINISSISAVDGNPGRSSYASSKSALIAQTLVLSREIGTHNIRVNAIAPGLIDTDMLNKNTSKEIIDSMKNNISMKRLGKPDEIANVALFLASDLSSYINGQVIRVDGGI